MRLRKEYLTTPELQSSSIYKKVARSILTKHYTSTLPKPHKTYFEFFCAYWDAIESEPLSLNWHHEFLCNELEIVARKVINREPFDYNLIINISPGETKSTLATVMLPVWIWTIDPTIRIITASYSKDLALYHSLKSRDLIQTSQFQDLYGDSFEMRKDMNAKSYYGNNAGGQRISASAGSTITGKHAHLIVLDDPINPQQSKSDKERENINEWCKTTINSRKVSEKVVPTILVMQRLHEQDPTAVLAKKWATADKLKWIRLPADDRYEISPPELKERYSEDGPLRVMNPERKPAEVIKRKEDIHTSEDFAGQYGQDPQPSEGNILKKQWLRQTFSIHDLKSPVWNATLDGAYTSNESNSATAVLVWASIGGKIYLRDYRNWWLEFPDLVQKLPAFLSASGFNFQSTLYVEPKAIGKTLVQTMRDESGLNIIEDPLPPGVTSQEGKITRVNGITPYVRAMNVFINEGIDWDAFEKQCTTFPNASHNDMVDTLVMACEKMRNNYSPLSDPNAWSI